MTSMPQDKTPLDAVDALFDLRAQIAALREREAELCDEIRTFATETGTQDVSGTNRVAVIETRRPTRVDPGKLPTAILNDPHFFATEEQTVVLLWPRATAVAQSGEAELDDPAERDLQDELRDEFELGDDLAPAFAEAVADAGFPSDEIDLPTEDLPTEDVAAEGETTAPENDVEMEWTAAPELETAKPDTTELAEHDIPEAAPDSGFEAELLDTPASFDTVSFDAVDTAENTPEVAEMPGAEPAQPQMRTIGVPPEEADPFASMLDSASEPVLDQRITDTPVPDAPIAEAFADMSGELDAVAHENTPFATDPVTGVMTDTMADTTTDTVEIAEEAAPDAPSDETADETAGEAVEDHADMEAFTSAEDPFGLKRGPLRAASPAMPLVDGSDAPETATPRDLRPTEHADLMPLAGLHEEEIAQVMAEADAPLEAATLPDALDLSQSLEAEADRKFADGFDETADFEAPENDTSALDTDDDFKPTSTPFASRRFVSGSDI
ncbi:hypothetical protein [Celeribacter neptunius]|uniref:Uncharacterized protein n=1 Tax=Celeribacter neptunius TaxID=588602 RepID=A0A1I3JFT9_9RHOB|nr:hypothetical protein [Celeribacter neptunius]SFI59137.1 hypothetical protein SAMN04487991_0344 [Celeribacter neptunius]